MAAGTATADDESSRRARPWRATRDVRASVWRDAVAAAARPAVPRVRGPDGTVDDVDVRRVRRARRARVAGGLRGDGVRPGTRCTSR